MDPDYYGEYHRNEREHWWFRARESILRGQLERARDLGMIHPQAGILNIGAATGRSSEWLADFGRVASLEYDADCCRLTRERTGLDIVQGSILELPWPDESFDLACAFDVIEHVEDDRLAVREMRRVVRPGGMLFVTVPACGFLWGEHDAINHHYRRYGLRELRSLFEGCDVVRCCGFNSILFAPIAAHRLSRRLVDVVLPRSGRKPRSDFSRSRFRMLDPLLERLFRAERAWLDRGIGPPWGVSAMLIARRR
jgi:SAM-dependent methyltransferase